MISTLPNEAESAATRVRRLPIEPADIHSAAARLAGIAHRTPVIRSRTLSDQVGAEVVLKAESFQRMGAFKFRGAYNCVSQLTAKELERGVVASSSGNHAQALSLAARLCGTRAVILMPADTPASKLAATRSYGGQVLEFDRFRDDRERLTASLAAEQELTIVHAYDDARVMAGAGTTALELIEDAGPLDTLLIPTGGGGLLSGCATAAKAADAATTVIGVEPQASDDTQRSLRAGRRVAVEVKPTIADGQQLPVPGALTFEVVHRLVDDIVTVSDAEIVAAMQFAFERLKLVLEPSGASGLAALMAGRVDVRGGRIGVVLSGGNIDTGRFAAIVGSAG